MTNSVRAISVVGLGKLGSPMAACFAAKGFQVVAVDVDEAKVNAIAAAEAPVFEPRLGETLRGGRDRLTATTDIETAVLSTDATFIVVATPTDDAGGFSLRFVLPVCESIGAALRGKDAYHLVALTSTVMPGATGTEVRAALERSSGKQCGNDFGLCYSPEFIALGSVIHDFLNPDFLLIGESDERAGAVLADVYRNVVENEAAIARMSFVNAELAKISVNTFVTTKIAFANMIARICERLPGADSDVVTQAIGLDSRIGPRYLRGAISYGGPCFPRDNVALAVLARSLDAPAPIAEATDRFNRDEIQRLAHTVEARARGGTIAILGLSYKPNTDVVDESPGLMLASALWERGASVIAYDPVAMGNAQRVLDGSEIRFAQTLEDAVRGSDAVVLMTPWEEFRDVARLVGNADGPRVVVDCWRLLDPVAVGSGVEHIRLGMGDSFAGAPTAEPLPS